MRLAKGPECQKWHAKHLQSLSVCGVQGEIDLSQYFLPRLHIYVGGILLVNISLNQTLKSLITFKQTLHYTALEREK